MSDRKHRRKLVTPVRSGPLMVPEYLLPEDHDLDWVHVSPEESDEIERSIHRSTHDGFGWTVIIGQDGQPYYIRVSNRSYICPMKRCEECARTPKRPRSLRDGLRM